MDDVYYAWQGPIKGAEVQLAFSDDGTREGMAYNIAQKEMRCGHGPFKVWELGTFADYEAVRSKLGKRGGPEPAFVITDEQLREFRDAMYGVEDEGGEWQRNVAQKVAAMVGCPDLDVLGSSR